MNINPPTNKVEALETALKLAIVAPDNDKMEMALSLARQLAQQLEPEQVEQIKTKIETEFVV